MTSIATEVKKNPREIGFCRSTLHCDICLTKSKDLKPTSGSRSYLMLVRVTSRNPKSQNPNPKETPKNGIDLTERLDGVSPYQCVLAKISLAGRRSAEPVWRLSLAMGLGDCLELGPWELGFSRGRSLQNYRRLRNSALLSNFSPI